MTLLRALDGECDVVADSGGSQTQQRNTRIRTGSTSQHSWTTGHRMSRCCGLPTASVTLLRIPGGPSLNNATLESAPAQQRNTRAPPITECRVVAATGPRRPLFPGQDSSAPQQRQPLPPRPWKAPTDPHVAPIDPSPTQGASTRPVLLEIHRPERTGQQVVQGLDAIRMVDQQPRPAELVQQLSAPPARHQQVSVTVAA